MPGLSTFLGAGETPGWARCWAPPRPTCRPPRLWLSPEKAT